MLYIYKYIIIYTITLSIGLFSYKKYNHNLQLKLWLYFLVYSFITEIVSRYIIETYNVRAIRMTNTWWFVNSFFYLFFFLSKIKNINKRKVIKGLIAVFSIYSIVSIVFLKNFGKEYFVGNWILGQLFVVLTIILYYTELLKSDAILNIKHSMFFWISIGALIFNIGILPVFVIGELIDWQGIFRYIIVGLNIVLSLCFITGFIISKKEYNI